MPKSKRRTNNPLALAVLGLLAEEPAHPYEMARTMENRAWHKSIKLNYGSLYTVIDALLQEGAITVQETVREGKRPERTVYALTDTGRARFMSWLERILREPAKEYPQFEAGLTLMGHLGPDGAAKVLGARVEALENEIDTLRVDLSIVARRFALPRLFGLEAEFELAMKEAELRWIRQLLDDLHTGALTWPDEAERLRLRAEATGDDEPESTRSDQT